MEDRRMVFMDSSQIGKSHLVEQAMNKGLARGEIVVVDSLGSRPATDIEIGDQVARNNMLILTDKVKTDLGREVRMTSNKDILVIDDPLCPKIAPAVEQLMENLDKVRTAIANMEDGPSKEAAISQLKGIEALYNLQSDEQVIEQMKRHPGFTVLDDMRFVEVSGSMGSIKTPYVGKTGRPGKHRKQRKMQKASRRNNR